METNEFLKSLSPDQTQAMNALLIEQRDAINASRDLASKELADANLEIISRSEKAAIDYESRIASISEAHITAIQSLKNNHSESIAKKDEEFSILNKALQDELSILNEKYTKELDSANTRIAELVKLVEEYKLAYTAIEEERVAVFTEAINSKDDPSKLTSIVERIAIPFVEQQQAKEKEADLALAAIKEAEALELRSKHQ